ncbi:hydrophobic/amphiphilic exporter-1, HAE1 family [Lutibacter agarilyticus]|uniref:Hydrophobic/amphiphilic exporter-1, HAE1 family n=1 Tax=Lutibacter agarilyticus TaxID=1109740 RepID=A0A238VH80_9FLAO|nr:efflux RND transporter permease subunit [Lutibacter agarilyticus]SNR33750.1 hydrophobic/amphiphilic exporter-1, HAE1 family [Lutibacter agarilyticus]
MSENKGNFFVHRPIVAIVIAIVIVIVGTVSLIGLPIEQYPNLTPPIVQVSASYTGANAINVEESVATPLEQQINGVDNMIYMKSTNANDGSMNIQVSFDVGTDPDMNTVLTQNKVSAASAKLPSSVTKLGVTTQKALPNILMLVALTSDDGRYDQDFLGNYALINIKDQLARVKGIGKVDVMGASDYSMRIWIKPDRISHLGLTVPEIINAINEQNIIVPGGKFGAEPAPVGTEFTYTVRLPERFNSVEAFEDIVVRTQSDGSQIKLGDVASVNLGVETYNMIPRMNGKTSAVIALYQAPGSNGLELATQIKEQMEDLSKNFPESIRYDVSLDTTKAIEAGIKDIVVTLIVALILVILVVFIFIQDWRATLIPTLAIPVSLIGAFIFFPMLGFTINVLSLLGLVLAIGIVVDDAIVVVEAVQVNIANGMNSKEATLDAMRKVTAPVIATTLVLVAVFIPVAGMAGITGLLYQQFAITIVVSVLVSSVNALTLSPALCSLLLKEPKPYKGPLGWFFGKFNKGMDKSTDSYMSYTNIVSRKIKRGIVFIVLMTLGAGVFGSMVPGGFIPEEDMGYFFVNVQLPNAASIQRADVVTKEVEKILQEIPEVEYITTATGYSILSGAMISNTGFLFVGIKDWAERDITAKEVIDIVNKKLFFGIKDAQAFAFGPPAIPGLGNGSGFSIMLQDRVGNTPQYLAENSMKFIKAANERPEIGRASTTFQANVPQRFMDIDKEKALKLGVKLNDLYTTVGAFMGGAYVNDFTRFGRLYKTYIQAEPEYRVDPSQINNFFIKNNQGEMVPLSTLATIKPISGPDYTTRFNLYRSVEVTGAPAEGYTSNEARQALKEVAAEVLPADMGYTWNAMSFQEEKASGSLTVILTFSLVFVFLILAAQYESWSLPFAILLGTPFAIFGALFFLWIGRLISPTFENNIFAQVSFVMLIGMAAKNAILIVEFANDEFKSGLSLFDAAVKAARSRFRPILMTAFSFILGVFPLVIASGSGAEARKVMGMALLGGMSIATFLGVFLYPMLFIFIGKIGGYEKKRDQAKKLELAKNAE